jgi:hypothetical protein
VRASEAHILLTRRGLKSVASGTCLGALFTPLIDVCPQSSNAQWKGDFDRSRGPTYMRPRSCTASSEFLEGSSRYARALVLRALEDRSESAPTTRIRAGAHRAPSFVVRARGPRPLRHARGRTPWRRGIARGQSRAVRAHPRAAKPSMHHAARPAHRRRRRRRRHVFRCGLDQVRRQARAGRATRRAGPGRAGPGSLADPE